MTSRRRRRRGGPRPARPSTAAAGGAGRPRATRSASRTTTGWAQLPPTQPSIVPSGWTMPRAPGRAEVGRWTATTVASANGRPAASSSAARREHAAVRGVIRPVRRTPFSWRIAHTFGGVIGMSMLRTPRCHSASTTALAIAGGAPTVADSPTPLAPSGWCGDGVTVLADLPGGRLDGRRQQVVHERAGQVVAVLVVGDLLVQRRGEAHRQPAVDLPVDDHRVDDVAAVVDRHEAADLDLPGALVDVDDADVRRRTGRSGSAGRSS